MADIKITELPQATSVSDSDELIIQQPSGTKRAGIADLPVGSPLSAGYGIDITNDIVTNTKPMNYEETGSVPSATPLNADQLQGHPASYFQKLLTAGSGIDISNDVISSFSRIELVWSNSSPASAFVGRVDLGITNAKAFIVVYRATTSSNEVYFSAFITTSQRVLLFGVKYNSSPYILFARPVNINFSAGTLYFDTAYSMPTYGSYGSSADNTYAIPYQIYALY